MSKGSSPSGTTTQTTINPVSQAQLPFLQAGWNQAQNLFDQVPYQYYPGQTLANPSPDLTAGYADMIDRANVLSGDIVSPATRAFQQGVGGGASVTNSPAFGAFQNIIGGTGNPGLDQLSATAGGQYLNSNPYLDKMFGAASDAVTRGYETATAPQADSVMEGAGRYGSGALANSRTQNELNLGQSLDNLAANIYGGNYAQERGLQTGAAGTLGGLANAAAGELQQGYDTGNLNATRNLALEPQLLSGALIPAQAEITGGQGLTGLNQMTIQDAMNRFYGTEQAPWQSLSQFLSAVGQPLSGSQTLTQPYFTNPTANALGIGLGGLGLAQGIGGQNGIFPGLISSLFSGGGGAGPLA